MLSEIPRPWSKISVDQFALDGKQCLVPSTTVIRAMKRNFAPYGIPDTCNTDNMAHSLTVMSSHGLRATMDLPRSSPHLITAVAMERQSP